MGMRIIRQKASPEDINEMLKELKTYIKLAVDLEQGILVGGGEYHSDCEEALLSEECSQKNIWGVDWHPESRTVKYGAMINIRPGQGNLSMEIENKELRKQIETIVRRLLEVESQ